LTNFLANFFRLSTASTDKVDQVENEVQTRSICHKSFRKLKAKNQRRPSEKCDNCRAIWLSGHLASKALDSTGKPQLFPRLRITYCELHRIY